MNIDGIGQETIEQLYNEKLIENVADISFEASSFKGICNMPRR
ncbi:hypothetical protein N9K77_00375 [bacterium]|nr:hypothetical protein [bacterium]